MTCTRRITRLVGAGIVVMVASGCASSSMKSPDPAVRPQPERAQTGYGETKDPTGAVSSIDSAELDQTRYARLGDVLEGRVPGLVVTRRTDGGYSLRIRGMSSLMGGNEPLVVVDGVSLHPQGVSRALATINPRDVHRVDVLKGPAAALYGSRGANGVVVITTKRP